MDTACIVVEATTDDRVENAEFLALVLRAPNEPVLFLNDRVNITVNDSSSGKFIVSEK